MPFKLVAQLLRRGENKNIDFKRVLEMFESNTEIDFIIVLNIFSPLFLKLLPGIILKTKRTKREHTINAHVFNTLDMFCDFEYIFFF